MEMATAIQDWSSWGNGFICGFFLCLNDLQHHHATQA
jgi:hypothetical protein